MLKKKLQLLAIAKTWACKTLPGFDDQAHRDLLARHGAKAVDGRISATTMTATQLSAALADYHARGWPRMHKITAGARTLDTSPQAQKIRAMWLHLHKQGVVRNPAESALAAYVKRQTGVSALQWLDERQTVKVIEALKAWIHRSQINNAGDRA